MDQLMSEYFYFEDVEVDMASFAHDDVAKSLYEAQNLSSSSQAAADVLHSSSDCPTKDAKQEKRVKRRRKRRPIAIDDPRKFYTLH